MCRKNKKRKGFTLVELLAVIALLAVIVIIAVPVIGNIIENVRTKAYERTEDSMEHSTKTYVITEEVELPDEEGETATVTLEELEAANLIDIVKDVQSMVECDGVQSYVRITYVDGDYTYDAHLKCDNYETDGTLADTDGDGVSNVAEIAAGTDYLGALLDSDADGLYNDYEDVVSNTSPVIADTDMDGTDDGNEIENGTDPLVYVDSNEGVLEYNSVGDYYIIGSLADLLQMNRDVNNLTGDTGTYELDDTYYLAVNIDLGACTGDPGSYTACSNDTDSNPANGNWTPIGDVTNTFTGNIYATMHSISNINVYNTATDYMGFIGKMTGGSIHDLTLNSPEIAGKNYIGIIGMATTDVDIEGLMINNLNMIGAMYVGGIIGKQAAGVTIKYSNVNGDVTASSVYVGGMVGMQEYGDIYYSTGSVNVTGSNVVGGLIGYGYGTSTDRAYVYVVNEGGSVTATSGTELYRCIGRIGNYISPYLIANDDITLNGSTVSVPASYADKNGMDLDINHVDLNSYEANEFDTYIGGKDSIDDYYMDYNSNGDVIFKNVKYEPIRFGLQGSGTSGDPYIINNADDLKQAAQKLNKVYSLTSNINMSGEKFVTLGSVENTFTGTFDGNGYTISNLVIDSSAGEEVGFIPDLTGTIKDVNFDNVYAIGYGFVGTVAGSALTGSVIEGINVTNIDINAYRYAGGILGKGSSNTIKDVYVEGDITCTENYVGGIAAQTFYSSITGVVVNAEISALRYTGGLIGYFYASSTITSTLKGAFIGGSIAGGDYNVERNIGYIVGVNYSTRATIADSSILVKGVTQTSADLTSLYGADASTVELQTIGTYEAIDFDVTSDSDGNGFYWTIENNIPTLQRVN